MQNDNSEGARRATILPELLARCKGSDLKVPTHGSKIVFSISTKDRVGLTKRMLKGVDTETGFDMIWCDGSNTEEGKDLPEKYEFKNVLLKKVYHDVRGGSGRAVAFSLEKMIELGYDYCGLLENDILLSPGWFKVLKKTIERATSEGIPVGAATVRSYNSRVIEYRDGYTINWAMGAGMVLFTRQAAQLIADAIKKYHYPENYYFNLSVPNKWYIRQFYAKEFGIDIGSTPEWYGIRKNFIMRNGDKFLTPPAFDWSYSVILYKAGLASVGSIPSLVEDTGADDYGLVNGQSVTSEMNKTGMNVPFVDYSKERLSIPEKIMSVPSSRQVYMMYTHVFRRAATFINKRRVVKEHAELDKKTQQ
jgi:hypothetical protein